MNASFYYLLTAWTLFFLIGLVFFLLGLLLGRIFWRGYKEKVAAIERENAKLREQAETLEQECNTEERFLENPVWT